MMALIVSVKVISGILKVLNKKGEEKEGKNGRDGRTQ
jgi:hypothetical protein